MKPKVFLYLSLSVLIGSISFIISTPITIKKDKVSPTEPVLSVTPLPTEELTATPCPTLDLYSREEGLPYDKLFTTKERRNYKTGQLTLVIPKLSLKEPIQQGTDAEALNKGPGLYDYAQLPGEGDRNVSIAAHRNKSKNGVISEWFFYYIDTLGKGDYIYLYDKDYIYRYVYDQTTIVEETDWSPIYSQGVSCITLTSCEPIGIADHRIIVRAILDDITPYDKKYIYRSKASE